MFNMASRYQYRKVRRLQKKSRRNFIITVIIITLLLYVTFTWILPSLIGGVGFIKNFTNPSRKIISPPDQITLAPPVLNIPYEATNTAQIEIKGYGNPGSKVQLFLDDDKKQTVSVSSEGSFIFKDVSLLLGVNNIYGKSIDDQGQTSLASKTLKIIYDNEKPTLNINEPEDNKKIQGGDRKVKISGKTENGAKIFINDAQVIVDKDGNFSSDQPLNDGDNNFNIESVDVASNTAEISRRVNYQP